MLDHLDNKSIVELFVKFLNEMAEHNTKSLPGIDVLQQSGQSVDDIARSGGNQENTEKQNSIKDNQKKIQQVLMFILEEKMSETNDMLTKLGAIEVLKSLLKKKAFYQTITSKKAYEIMTRHLVSDCDETKRFVYELMQDLITFYETHERIEKRINIDNFEDEELINSHSGSFANDKKSKNSKKLNQEVLKDISESELFHFFKVVIQEITADEIEKRFDQIKSTPEGDKLRLGNFFMSLIDFIAKASSTFQGFQYDINQVLIEKDVFIYLFDISEYYRSSDFLQEKIFKILTNIINAKNEDIQDMVRYLLEDTPLIPFLIKNKPQLVAAGQDEEAKS